MTDLPFIKLLTHLNKIKDITKELANEPIKKMFPKLEFLKGRNAKIYFPHLIKYQMEKVGSNSLEKVLDLIDPLMYKLYAPNKTLKEFGVLDNSYSQYIRNVIKERFGKDSSQYELSKQLTALTDEDKGSLIKSQSAKLEERNKGNRIEYDPEEVIKSIKNNITTEDPYKRGIALLLASGSRPIELYAKSTYTIEPNTPEGWIKQTYVAKKKGDKTKATVIKPILYIEPKKFIEEVKRLRNDLIQIYGNYETDGKIKQTALDKFQKAAKEIFNYKENFVSYTARPLYALVSFEKFGKLPNIYSKDGSISINEFMQKILGHDSLNTSYNYRRFKLKNDALSLTQTSNDIKIKQVELDKKIEDIEERMEDLNIQQKEEDESFDIENDNLTQKFKVLNVEYKKLKSDRLGRPPPLYRMELYGKQQKIPRSVVRLFYKQAAK